MGLFPMIQKLFGEFKDGVNAHPGITAFVAGIIVGMVLQRVL